MPLLLLSKVIYALLRRWWSNSTSVVDSFIHDHEQRTTHQRIERTNELRTNDIKSTCSHILSKRHFQSTTEMFVKPTVYRIILQAIISYTNIGHGVLTPKSVPMKTSYKRWNLLECRCYLPPLECKSSKSLQVSKPTHIMCNGPYFKRGQ